MKCFKHSEGGRFYVEKIEDLIPILEECYEKAGMFGAEFRLKDTDFQVYFVGDYLQTEEFKEIPMGAPNEHT